MIDRAKFFNGIRQQPFPGSLKQSQVDGVNIILDEWEEREEEDLRQLAYILATAFHETAKTMQPIREYGSQSYLKSKKYYPWYGRGYVQLTWDYNYKKFQPEVLEVFGVDIIKDPDNAMIPDVAAYVMFEGMYRGTFNGKGKGLDFYFHDTVAEWKEARRTVNVLDKADAIAAIAKQFYADLIESVVCET